MIKHIVMLKLRENTPELIEKLSSSILSMRENISQLRSIEVGVDIVHSERSYDLVLIAEFDTMQALAEYQAHSYHCNVVKKAFEDSVIGTVAIDYEI